MSKRYNAAAWFWVVAGDESRVYSSAAAAGYLPVSDATYAAFLDDGGIATRISSEAELQDVLSEQYPAGWAATDMRNQRNAALSAADIQINRLEDNGKDASAWRKYRNVLRDFPAQPGFPNIPLPKAPAM